MTTLLETYLRAWMRRHLHIEEGGQAEIILIALVAFLIGLLLSGRRVVVQ
jgi:hydrogenase-4 membrane subunit HyfE